MTAKKQHRTEEQVIKEMDEVMSNFNFVQRVKLKKSGKILKRIKEKRKKNNGSHAHANSISNDELLYDIYMKELGLTRFFDEMSEIKNIGDKNETL